MCAINGFNWENTELINKMNNAVAHRGPDASGIFVKDGISLGHRRLSIIDLTLTGAQPMTSFDGNETLVFNGEIYNFNDLRRELGDYPYKGTSDTEVIIAAYRKWGIKAFAKFNGMFAFALWDKKKGELVLARDKSGIKPLYYYFKNGKLIFSSEIKGIFEHDVPRKLSKEAFALYMRLLFVPGPLSMVEDIQKLLPGTSLVFKGGQMTSFSFDSYESVDISGDHKTLIRSAIEKAVSRQLVSDRPVGFYLSGGIDSTAILASAAKIGGSLETFSVGFDVTEEEQREKFNADAILAKRTAEFFGTKHHELLVTPAQCAASFDEVVRFLDEPVANATMFPMFFLSKFAKERVAVVLSGDGGDELFGGYPRYKFSRMQDLYCSFVPSFLRKSLDVFSTLEKLDAKSFEERYWRFMAVKDDKIKNLLSSDILNRKNASNLTETFEISSGNPTDMFMEADRKYWLIDEALHRSDTMSMAHGLEDRVPFLDDELVSLAKSLPLNEKVSFLQSKIILKESLREIIPDFIFSAPKRGWFSPGAKWLRRPEFKTIASEIFSDSYYPEISELFNLPELRIAYQDHVDQKNYRSNTLWAALIFLSWARQFKITL